MNPSVTTYILELFLLSMNYTPLSLSFQYFSLRKALPFLKKKQKTNPKKHVHILSPLTALSGSLHQDAQVQTPQIWRKTTSEYLALTLEMVRGMLKSFPPCRRKPHGPDPLRETLKDILALLHSREMLGSVKQRGAIQVGMSCLKKERSFSFPPHFFPIKAQNRPLFFFLSLAWSVQPKCPLRIDSTYNTDTDLLDEETIHGW